VRAAVVIPARYASSRLPGKPILERVKAETGRYLIEHVYDRAAAAEAISRVIVATDDERIARVVEDGGGEARMTSSEHRCGTDRVAEVAEDLNEDIVVNVQGDEPEITPEQISQVVRLLESSPQAAASTLAIPIDSEEQWKDPNAVKVVLDVNNHALYFSRSPLPYPGEATPADSPAMPLLHIGMYGYRRDFLLRFAEMPAAPIEQAEQLEQLRILWHGHTIQVGVTEHRSVGIDTPHDLERWLQSRAKN